MDVVVFLLQAVLCLLTLPLHLLALFGCWQPLWSKYFPYLMAVLTLKSNQKIAGKKQELFSRIKKLAGASGKVTLLELGCGTGANFEFYPAGCRVTCIDPNPHFKKLLTESMAKNKHLQYEEFLVAPGEDMSQVADGSMDAVVCTLVLCSVQSPKKVLQEVQRVLRPVTPSRDSNTGLLTPGAEFFPYPGKPLRSWRNTSVGPRDQIPQSTEGTVTELK
ncbi:methyltransferase-like protein 7B isoform X2 [Trichosurus vulpecula]|uniref:methyltransferase-like protein 7B isoform X2 n=1 Tax=Trichosurus vulpecula TaxID=9337 RepID=UPI00186AE4FA|nr:methyltransferase-like protein 7B isoform X2 [Trichosurus vulpecula]